MIINNKSSILGIILFVLFFVQFFFKIQWNWLLELQEQEMYKRWSGLGLAVFITFQWILTLTRVVKRFRKYAQKTNLIHKWLGALSPFFFYIHSIGFGYGYLLLLSYIFFINTLIGYLNLDVIKNNNDLLFRGWMIFHVAFSIVITILMVFHINMVFYYK